MMNNTSLSVRIDPRTVGGVLCCVVVGLLVGHLAFTVGTEVTGHPLYFLPRLFDLGGEANLPAFLSALNLLLASGLLWIIWAATRHTGGNALPWLGLALGFALMGVDEAAQIHEGLVGGLATRFASTELFGWHYTWIVVYAPVVIALAAVYAPFLLRLPWRFRTMFLVAGAAYVGGSLGVEMFEAHLRRSFEEQSVAILLSQSVEETGEMAGVALFTYALLEYIKGQGVRVTGYVGQVSESFDLSVPVLDTSASRENGTTLQSRSADGARQVEAPMLQEDAV